MRRTVNVIVRLCFSLSLLVTLVASASAAHERSVILERASSASVVDCKGCYSGEDYCPELLQHADTWIILGPEHNFSGGSFHDCNESRGTCTYEHTAYGGETRAPHLLVPSIPIDKVRRALEGGNVQRVAQLVIQDSLVRYNVRRHAVQIVGNAKAIVAHFPLTSEVAERLEHILGARVSDDEPTP